MPLRRSILLLSVAVAWVGLAAVARAHVFEITDTLLVLKADGSYFVDITADVDALAMGVSPETPGEEIVSTLPALTSAEFEQRLTDLRALVQRRVRIRFDGQAPATAPAVTFPELEANLATRPGLPSVLGVTIRLAGLAPVDAKSVTWTASRAFGTSRLTVVHQPTGRSWSLPLRPGEESPAFGLDGSGVHGATSGPVSGPSGDDDGSSEFALDRRDVIGRYLVLGFEHIIPKGLDHILFVVGLFLLSTRLGPLLWQVSAFTIAHTCTLGLAIGGWVKLPSEVVEPLIALSIAYVAIENLWTSELKPWRPALVFAFGLLHGLGFAGVLTELGLPTGELMAALLAFNVGVELGQLGVILAALVLVGWCRGRTWYRRGVVVPVSGLIALAGLYWAVERVGLV